jgi:hypothetical protein
MWSGEVSGSSEAAGVGNTQHACVCVCVCMCVRGWGAGRFAAAQPTTAVAEQVADTPGYLQLGGKHHSNAAFGVHAYV